MCTKCPIADHHERECSTEIFVSGMPVKSGIKPSIMQQKRTVLPTKLLTSLVYNQYNLLMAWVCGNGRQSVTANAM